MIAWRQMKLKLEKFVCVMVLACGLFICHFREQSQHPVGLLLLSPSRGDGKYGNISLFGVTAQLEDIK